MNEPELISRARSHGDAVALRPAPAQAVQRTYADLLNRSAEIASELLGEKDDLSESRIAFLVPGDFDYIATQWAIWRSGGVAVPLCLSAAEAELEYTLTDSRSSLVATTRAHAEKVEALCKRLDLPLLIIDEVTTGQRESFPDIGPDRSAMILYTSGTTSKPKGVVSTHRNIQAQIEMLVEAWEWQATDSIPLFLPLHHIHGIINVTCCALWSGATIEAFPGFQMQAILERVAAGAYTVFMAVPTIYVKLIQTLEAMEENERDEVIRGFAEMRLMVSGSAALPASVHEKWTELTGQKLLERYGMTEIGMALSNPFHGERRPGAVGQPLPSVEVRLKADDGGIVTEEETPGEIQVRGPAVFHEYWDREDITRDSFDEGWFRTGDMAVIESGYYRIMGRQSIDIIKSGGYKLSALEIEATLLDHPAIRECAVVGVADDTWGEAVAAAVVLEEPESMELESLRDWCRSRMSAYRIPQRLLVRDSLPRNAMGKVTKPAVRNLFEE